MMHAIYPQEYRLLLMLQEIEVWSKKYEFAFQFWGKGNNNVYIEKDGVEIASFGCEESIHDILGVTLAFIYKINRTPNNKRVFNKLKNS